VIADGTEEYRKELLELQVAAQTVVESIGSSEESEGSLADRLRAIAFLFFLVSPSEHHVP